ncbi:MAG: enoyl-CoA hydratase/isomerase family protein [Jhaorihella sp.]
MADIDIRVTGRAGRITFTRPQALNAMSYDMCMAIDAEMRLWREDDAIDLVVIDAEGDKAFCAGGDVAELYETGRAGEFGYGRAFWRDEYRLNAYIAEYPKPVVSFMQGFTMGGGVGIGCHGSHRVVDASSRIAMPECGIGLVPDVGGSLLLARAPGWLGVYLGITAARMDPGDAILAGFADHYIARKNWSDLIEMLEASGDASHVTRHAQAAPQGTMSPLLPAIDRYFGAPTLGEILAGLRAADSQFARDSLKAMARNSPLSMACTLEMIQRLRTPRATIRDALKREYRFTWRAMERGDFLEGVRAQIIDKDRQPMWQFDDMEVPSDAVAAMLAPLGADGLTFAEEA